MTSNSSMPQARSKRWMSGTFGLAAAALIITLNGCVGYRLGTTLPPGIGSVYVPSAINETTEPQLEVEVTRAVTQEFQRDGTLQLGSEADSDSRLDIKLVGFSLDPVRYERDRAHTAREYRMLITANITFSRTDSGEALLSRTVQGDTTFIFTGDLASSKIQAVPQAAADLAHDIVESMVEYW